MAEPAAGPPALNDPDTGLAPRRGFGFRWFLPELRRHRALWGEVLLASLALQCLALGLPLFTQAIIDKVVVHHAVSTLVALAGGMAVVTVFSSLLAWLRQSMVLHAGTRIDAVLGAQVFEHLFRLPVGYFQQRPTGVIAARLQGVETVREFLSSAAITLLLDVPFLFVFVAVMFWYSPVLTLIALAALVCITVLSLAAGPLFQDRLNRQFLHGAATQAFLTEYVAGIETVKALGVEPLLDRRYRDLFTAYLGASFRSRQLANTYGTLAGSLEQLMSLAILVAGAWLVMTTAQFTVGMLVAFQMFAARLSQPLLRLTAMWQQFQQARLAVRRLGDIMDATTECYGPDVPRIGGRAARLELRELSFRYAEHLPFLYRDWSLDIEFGSLVAVTGASGSGKSTLARLLLGFHMPTSGVIRLQGIDIRQLPVTELRGFYGMVPQETTLFSGTLLDNLRLANPQATAQQVAAACALAGIHEFIVSLPQGYDTPTGERGTTLSGGQRQRIAIARALLKGARLLLFDEATSSLDSATAEQIGRTINGLKGRATVLFIAHQLPRSLQPDRIVRLGGDIGGTVTEHRVGASP